MADIKLTKNELKAQKNKLEQLQKYLPTLQLKKALLQAEVVGARQEKEFLEKQHTEEMARCEKEALLLSMDMPFPIEEAVSLEKVDIEYENIAGAELPKLRQVLFRPFQYDLYATPVWTEGLLEVIKKSVRTKIMREYALSRLLILERELREVTIRVNLFDKVLIPRCKENIKKIRVFLGDLQLSQVAQAKVAKAKIIQKQKVSAK